MLADNRTYWIAAVLIVAGTLWLAAVPDPRSEGIPQAPDRKLFVGPILCLVAGFGLCVGALASKWKARVKAEQSRQGILRELKYGLQALAMPANVQMQLYAPITDVHDELLNDCDHWIEVCLDNFGDELTDEQRSALAAVVKEMDTWTDADSTGEPASDLATRPFWERMRELSSTALGLMNWPIESPPQEVPHGEGCWRRLPE